MCSMDIFCVKNEGSASELVQVEGHGALAPIGRRI
jgi:hypothetical protein